MVEYAFAFWVAVMGNLLLLVFGTLHYRIDRSIDKVYSFLLVIGIVLMLAAAVGWIVTKVG